MTEKRRKPRIIGLYNHRTNEWEKLVYLHNNAEGVVCVNGEPGRIVFRQAGDALSTNDYGADFSIILPSDFVMSMEFYFAVNAGETLMWVDTAQRISVVNAGFLGVSAPVEIWRQIKAGVLTVSDKGSRGERRDTAGPALADMAASLGIAVSCRKIVPDDRKMIADTLRSWADEEHLHLILTTGGTGLAPRDVTPEAIMDVQERLAPGFGEAMRNRSMAYTPRGFLTRSIAATRGTALIISFPGSERAVRQCFEAIAPALRHGVETLNGWDAECGAWLHS